MRKTIATEISKARVDLLEVHFIQWIIIQLHMFFGRFEVVPVVIHYLQSAVFDQDFSEYQESSGQPGVYTVRRIFF